MRVTAKDIKIRFDEYNKKYFNGVLLPCNCHVIIEKGGTLGFYAPIIKNGNIVGNIWISQDVDWNEEDLREVIIHEMIHHYIKTIEGHRGGLFGHNWRFKRQCKRLKKEYGLIIHSFSFDICHIGEKKPTNFFQKIRRFIGF